MTTNFEMAIMDFLQLCTRPFLIEDIIKAERLPNTAVVHDAIQTLITVQRLAFYDPHSKTFRSRAGIFTGTQFSIAPTRQEIMQGILYIGHRCMPFLNPEVMPHQILFTYNGHIVPTKRVTIPTDEVYPHYMLFGEEYVPQYLSLDNEENNAAYLAADFDEPDSLAVTVLDMASLYWELHFEPEDRFTVTVLDWMQGIVELNYQPAEKVNKKAADTWFATLEKSFFKSFEAIGPGNSMDEQSLYAFLCGFDTLKNSIHSSLEEYMDRTERITIQPYGVESRFWKTGEDIPVSGDWINNSESISRSPIEDMFWRLGFALPDYIIDAYIRNALYHRNLTQNSLINLLLPNFDMPDSVKKFIYTELEDMAEAIKDEYNWFADQKLGALRSRLIDLHSGVSGFIHRIDSIGIDIDDLQGQSFIVLSQLLKHICGTIDSLEQSGDSDLSEFDLESLYASIDGMEESFFEVKTQITESLSTVNKTKFAIISNTKERSAGLNATLTFSPNSNVTASQRDIVIPEFWNLGLFSTIVCASCGLPQDLQTTFYAVNGEELGDRMMLQTLKQRGITSLTMEIQLQTITVNIAILLKNNYKGSKILPFCEYAAGNGFDYAKTAISPRIIKFPGKVSDRSNSVNHPADKISSAEEITTLLQRMIRQKQD